MPRLHKKQLLQKTIEAIENSGWNTVLLSSGHPFDMLIFNEDDKFKIRVYIWNMTHGGGQARPADEYRIQITGVNRFETEKDSKTLILGWWDEIGVFAGFDFRKHSGLLGFSPSMQIRENYLRDAYENGFSACNKGNNEIAIAFKPDFLVEYTKNLEYLHDFGKNKKDFETIKSVADNPLEINTEDLKITGPRRTALISAVKALRDNNFTQRVLTAYGYRCAVCAIQLDLLDAAHIVPVAADGSDHTSNGLSLCALHHRAFDRSLIAIDDDYKVLLSDKKSKLLKEIGHDEGLDEFRRLLRPMIILPPAITDRPNNKFLKVGRDIRRWEG